MKNTLVQVLLVVTLVLLGMIVYNNKVIDAKNQEIAAINQKQKNTQEKLERISVQLNALGKQIETANKSYLALTNKIEVLDKKKINYTEEVRKVKDANKDAKEFLDRKLPDDVKRLLNDAISE